VRSTTRRRSQDNEALHVIAPHDDLHVQHRHLCHPGFNLRVLSTDIGPVLLNAGMPFNVVDYALWALTETAG
jgi:hypothetical protein